LPEATRAAVKKLREDLVSTYFGRLEFVNPKYVRKYVLDKMIELEIPESVADFIQGRVATRIGAKHYLSLARQASNFYPKYLKHAEILRNKTSTDQSSQSIEINRKTMPTDQPELR